MSAVTAFRAGLLVAVVALVAAGAAYVISAGQPKTYQASTDLVFESFASPDMQVLGAGFAVGGQDADRRTATNLMLVKARDIAERTARAAPDLGYSASEIAGRISATVPGPVDLIRVMADAETPQKARRLVVAYVKQFKRARREREQRRARSAIRALEDALVRLGPALRNGAEGDTLRQQIGQLEVIARLGNGLPAVVDGAYASSVAASPSTKRNVLFGLVFGVLLGIGLVALRSAAIRERVIGTSAVRDNPDVRSDWD